MGVNCDWCKSEIKYEKDLLLTTGYFKVTPYHKACYKKMMDSPDPKLIRRKFYRSHQRVYDAIYVIAGIGFLFLENYRWISILMVVGLIQSIYIYNTYERPYKTKK